MKQIVYSKSAIKTLRKTDKATFKLLTSKIELLASSPDALASNIKKLQGVDAFRLRVGGWRIIYTETGVILTIVKIAPRGKAY